MDYQGVLFGFYKFYPGGLALHGYLHKINAIGQVAYIQFIIGRPFGLAYFLSVHVINNSQINFKAGSAYYQFIAGWIGIYSYAGLPAEVLNAGSAAFAFYIQFPDFASGGTICQRYFAIMQLFI